MWVFVDTKFGETFSFDDLIYQSRVSDIKRRIEESHGMIPVSTQRLFFNGVELLKDNQLHTYRIRKNSRLLLEIRDDHVNNQMPQQSPTAIQGFVPSVASSNYDQVPPSHATSSASFFNQDPRTMARSNQVLRPQSHASESFFNQDRLVGNDVLASFSVDEFVEGPPFPWTEQETKKMEGSWPGTRGDHNVNVQESSGRANRNQDLSPQPPQKLTVTMTQYDKPGRDFLVDVNSSDNVKELRKQREKYQLDLPAKGYFFLHKEIMRVLDRMNRVANGDTIVIIPEPAAIEDFYT